MRDRLSAEAHASDLPLVLGNTVETDRSGNVLQIDGEKRRREIVGDSVGETLNRRRRSPDMQRDRASPERREETEAFDMVEVEVRQDKVDLAHAFEIAIDP